MKRLLAAAAIIAAAAGAAHAGPALPLKVAVIARPAAATIFEGDGKPHLAYELYVANFNQSAVRIDALRLSPRANSADRGGTASQSFSGDDLRHMFSTIAGHMLTPQDPVLKPGAAGVLFVFLDRDPGAKIFNTLEVEEDGKPDTRQPVAPAPIIVWHTAPISISPPLRGNNWWTPNGPANDSIHRRTVIAFGPAVVIPERYAVDWIKLGADGNSFHGDPKDNGNYYAERSEIHAVADGRVVSVLDGVPENVPNSPTMAVTITLANIAGNSVIEDLGGGHYALYAHMIPGTVRVKPGDRVTDGQILGLLGNSGNSTEPHLHFQISGSPEPLAGEGEPFLLSEFIRRDYHLKMNGENPVGMTVGTAHKETRQTFMNLDLGDFGAN
ncbi:MAG TPA: M23 family metallopeptidase [Candidatus Binataceae bacterium]|nr:M23 family metallopeptidase [Candidatus Binataceae bacterium]HVC44433.1 M23 family metallopeptidase [Candidatus Binataceae bacterium]